MNASAARGPHRRSRRARRAAERKDDRAGRVKIELIDRLSATGLRTIEATSFVSPKWVPQLADAAEVLRHRKAARRAYPVLVPNLQGYERARAVGVEEIAVFTAASEAFNRKNINASIDESIERFAPVLERARVDGVKVRGYVSTVLGCPYQGDVPVADVVRVAKRMHALGCYEISLGDTIGIGTPSKARAMLRAVAARNADERARRAFPRHARTGAREHSRLPRRRRRGRRQLGVRHRRLSVRERRDRQRRHEDVVYMLDGMGIATGVDLDKLIETGLWLSTQLARDNGSKVGKAA